MQAGATQKKGVLGKKRRAVLRDNITSISDASLLRMALKRGVPSLAGDCYEELRGILKVFLERILRDTVTYTEYFKRKTVAIEDVMRAYERLNPCVKSEALIKGEVVDLNGKVHDMPTCKTYESYRQKAKKESGDGDDGKKKGKARKVNPEQNILRKINYYQKASGCVMLAKAPFERLCREVAQDFKYGLHFSKEAILAVQVASEEYLMDIIDDAALITRVAKRKAVQPSDLQAVRRIKRERA